MKKIFILLSLIMLSSPAWSQDFSDVDQYPEVDPASMEGEEFNGSRGLPESDYEEVPREEQEYIPEQDLPEEMAPEEIYEADEEYIE